MENKFLLILKIIFTYTTTLLFVKERGPFSTFEKIRDYFGIFHTLNDHGDPITIIDNEEGPYNELKDEIGYALTCPVCLSFYVSLLSSILPNWIIKIGAVWGVSTILFQILDFEEE